MGKIKIIIFYFSIFFFFCTIGAMCPEDNERFLKDLADLKEEVAAFQKLLNDKEDQKSKLQKEIAMKDAKIKNIYKDIEEVKKRCP
jgi:septal ring factor EnvC (AmiA/AmiB activator)